jgi:hypothetical protein
MYSPFTSLSIQRERTGKCQRKTNMTNETPLLVVVGATGTQGTAVISHFHTRNPSSPKAKTLAGQGVEIVQADLNQLASLETAFIGATAIFAYTNFASRTFSSEAKAAVASGKAKTLPEAGEEMEFQQGRNIADAAATVAATGLLEGLVWSTTADPAVLSGGKLGPVHEMNGKARVWEYMVSRPGLTGRVSSVTFGVFVESLMRFPEFYGWTKEKTIEGKTIEEGGVGGGVKEGYYYVFKVPLEPAAPMAWIQMQNDAGSWVSALLKAPAGLEVKAVGGYLSFEELASILEKELAVQVKAERVPLKEYVAGNEGGVMRDLAELLRAVAAFGIREKDGKVLGAEEVSGPFGCYCTDFRY